MGNISLYILLMLVPIGGAFEGTEGIVSDAQTTETCPGTARISNHPVRVTTSNWGTILKNRVTVPSHGDTTMVTATTVAISLSGNFPVRAVSISLSGKVSLPGVRHFLTAPLFFAIPPCFFHCTILSQIHLSSS